MSKSSRRYRLFWDVHKWIGITLSLVLAMIAVTGLLLLVKKDFGALQPPTLRGAEGGSERFVSLQDLFAAVFAEGHPDFETLDDIDRVDFRPGKRIHKVRSRHNHREMQVDAVTGVVLVTDWRPSDLIESIHDGSFFGDFVHDYFMPLVAAGLLLLVATGLYLWLAPLLRKRRKKKLQRSERSGSAPTAST
ncbi:MAG: PepSY-associated TM helix domain-containing protein [Planctomycetota bacterium]